MQRSTLSHSLRIFGKRISLPYFFMLGFTGMLFKIQLSYLIEKLQCQRKQHKQDTTGIHSWERLIEKYFGSNYRTSANLLFRGRITSRSNSRVRRFRRAQIDYINHQGLKHGRGEVQELSDPILLPSILQYSFHNIKGRDSYFLPEQMEEEDFLSCPILLEVQDPLEILRTVPKDPD